MIRLTVLFLASTLLASMALAGPQDFAPGPLVKDYGPAAAVSDARVNAQSVFKVAFDISNAAPADSINRSMESAARFLNLHAAAGVPEKNISVALVVHGPAAMDVVTNARKGSKNASAGLVAALIAAGASIEVCGQTAAFRDINPDDLLPGVSMALSAMTAHARLQQQGYTLNPF